MPLEVFPILGCFGKIICKLMPELSKVYNQILYSAISASSFWLSSSKSLRPIQKVTSILTSVSIPSSILRHSNIFNPSFTWRFSQAILLHFVCCQIHTLHSIYDLSLLFPYRILCHICSICFQIPRYHFLFYGVSVIGNRTSIMSYSLGTYF